MSARARLAIAPLGDAALVVHLGDRSGDEVFDRVRAAIEQLRGAHPAITDVVAGFTTVTVHYDPVAVDAAAARTPHATLTEALEHRLLNLERAPVAAPRVVEIPVCYAGELAPDLEDVARHTRLTADQVVALHSGATYTVRMIGFTPGFPYLSGLDPRLTMPRRAEPRTRVAAGSVGIGGEQTGVYSMATPGGWNLIGRTPLVLFDAARDPAALLRVGDQLRFHAISREQFDSGAR
jgi:inhibitor of KinA